LLVDDGPARPHALATSLGVTIAFKFLWGFSGKKAMQRLQDNNDQFDVGTP